MQVRLKILSRATAVAILVAFSLAAAHPASAQTVLNFQVALPSPGTKTQAEYTGPGALLPAANTSAEWNYSTNPTGGTPTFGPAVDSSGHSSPVSLTVSSDNENGYNGGPNGITAATLTGTNPETLFNGYAYVLTGSNRTTGIITLRGLSANVAYTVDLYGVAGNYGTTRTTQFKDTNTGVIMDTDAMADDTSFIQSTATSHGSYVQFTGTTPASGTLVFDFSGTTPTDGGNQEGDFNGLQIAVAPGPTKPNTKALGAAVPDAKAEEMGRSRSNLAPRGRASGVDQ